MALSRYFLQNLRTVCPDFEFFWAQVAVALVLDVLCDVSQALQDADEGSKRDTDVDRIFECL